MGKRSDARESTVQTSRVEGRGRGERAALPCQVHQLLLQEGLGLAGAPQALVLYSSLLHHHPSIHLSTHPSFHPFGRLLQAPPGCHVGRWECTNGHRPHPHTSLSIGRERDGSTVKARLCDK